MPLLSYLGGVVEFPLIAPLPVVKGEALAITVPTWAPILTIGLSVNNFSYTQSHTKIVTGTGTAKKSSCETTAASTLAQLTLGDQAQYSCTYPGHADRVHRARGHSAVAVDVRARGGSPRAQLAQALDLAGRPSSALSRGLGRSDRFAGPVGRRGVIPQVPLGVKRRLAA